MLYLSETKPIIFDYEQKLSFSKNTLDMMP